MESLQLGNGDEDDDGLLAALDVDLTSRGDLEGSKLGLELGNVVLEVQESLGNLLLNLGGGSARSVGSAERSVEFGAVKTRRRPLALIPYPSCCTRHDKAALPSSDVEKRLPHQTADQKPCAPPSSLNHLHPHQVQIHVQTHHSCSSTSRILHSPEDLALERHLFFWRRVSCRRFSICEGFNVTGLAASKFEFQGFAVS